MRPVYSLPFIALYMLILAIVTPAQAATGGSISILFYPGPSGSGSCEESMLLLDFTATGVNDENGLGGDFVGIAFLDGNGDIIIAFPWSILIPLTETIGMGIPITSLPPISASPVTAELYDIPGYPPLASDQERYDYWVNSGVFLDSATTQVGAVIPNCGATSGDNADSPPGPPFDPGDHRLNREAWATAALYCQDDGSLQVYGINENANGYFVFSVSSEIMAADPPAENTVIASGEGSSGEISLWRLASGEFQLHAPDLPPETEKDYNFIFDGC